MESDEKQRLLSAWYEHGKELLNITAEFAQHQITAPDTPHDREVAKVLAFKFAQAVRMFRSLIMLARSGDGTSSLILMRALFESLVDVAYLIENPKDVWRYLEEAADLEFKLRHACNQYGPAPKLDSALKRPSPESLRESFGQLAEDNSSCKSWRRLSIKSRAKKSGYPDILSLYEMVYPTASAYVHGASGILVDYVRNLDDAQMEFHVAYDRADREIEPAVAMSAMIFLRFIAFLDALFQFGLRKRVEQLYDTQRRLEEDYLKRLTASFGL